MLHGSRGLPGQGIPPWDSNLPLNQKPWLPGTVNKLSQQAKPSLEIENKGVQGAAPAPEASSQGEVGLAAWVCGTVFGKYDLLLRSTRLLPPLTPLGRVGHPGRERAPFGPPSSLDEPCEGKRVWWIPKPAHSGNRAQLRLTPPVWLGYNSGHPGGAGSPQWS